MFRRKNKTNFEPAPIENTSDFKSKSSGDGDMAQNYEKNSVLVHDRFCPSLSSSFWLIFLFRAITTTSMPFISDCDETFNYWEPLHYLQYGYGMQTWEYSPDYAIRSYAYLTLYGVPAFIFDKILEVIPLSVVHVWRRMIVFYLVRLGLCAVTAYVEANYYRAVVERVSSRVGWYLLWLLILSPGMWQASVGKLS
jgi:alpha-1,2-mannosyltransferase